MDHSCSTTWPGRRFFSGVTPKRPRSVGKKRDQRHGEYIYSYYCKRRGNIFLCCCKTIGSSSPHATAKHACSPAELAKFKEATRLFYEYSKRDVNKYSWQKLRGLGAPVARASADQPQQKCSARTATADTVSGLAERELCLALGGTTMLTKTYTRRSAR